MRNRFELLLLFSARFIVGYPAAWLLAMATSLGLLVHAGTRNWKGDLAALHDLVPGRRSLCSTRRASLGHLRECVG